MRRGPKPAKSKEAKPPVGRKSPKNGGAKVHDPEKRLAEALEQQTATAEILGIISRSPADAQPVFDAIAVNALGLCDATRAVILRYDGALVHLAAHHNVDPEVVDQLERRFPEAPNRHHPTGRAILDRAVVHVPDLQAAVEFSGSVARQFGMRSHVSIPLLHQGRAIGAIGISRPTLGPFSDRQVALLQTFADQAVIAIENVRLFKELQARNAELTDALARETSTSEILRVISRSPTDVQPVFDAIVESAVRLCGGLFGIVHRFDGAVIDLAAHHNLNPEGLVAYRAVYPMPVSRETVAGRAILDGAVVHVIDSQDPEQAPWRSRAMAHATGFRSVLAAPMLREGRPIGVINVARREADPFSDGHIALLKTFADQAVIAVENVRLFTELQEKNRALTQAHAQVTESLDQQTATAEVLKAISRSTFDLRPVLQTLVDNATRLCAAESGVIWRFDGAVFHLAADRGVSPELKNAWARNPFGLGRGSATGRTALEGRTVHIPDVLADPEYTLAEAQQAGGFRTILGVPMLREGVLVGVFGLQRYEVRPFTDKQVELVTTFADQAVIAIENVRLFKELESRNKDLTEALDQQTATSEILRVISSSPTDVQPVFDTIVTSAGRLCGAESAVVYRFEEEMADAVALYNLNPDAIEAYHRRFPRRLRDTDYLWRVADGSVLNIADIANDPHTASNETFRSRDVHSFVLVPMVRDEQAIGAIRLSHHDVGAFSEERVRLLKTFAAQAVLAIENVRLLSELRARTAQLTRSVEELTALGEVSRALSSTLNLETVLRTIVLRANELAGTAGCTIWEYDETHEEFRLRASHYADEGDAALLQAPGRVTTIPRGQGVTTQVMERRQPVQIHDITTARDYESPIRRPLIEAGHRGLLGVPLLSEDQVIGVLAVTRKTPGEFESEIVRLLMTFATQSALAIQNARLFLEIEDKSRQLELASQHKSEFLANMSHELRTPLNAIIGFSEVLSERMFGDLNEKQEEYLKDIYASGTHLLSLINDILDLSKIEAGRMELELTDFDLPQAIDNALILVRERAGRRGIALEHSVDERLGEIRGDERKVKQVLLNLLSNALKFTPEGGRVEVRAAMVDGMAEISLTDTGVGIAPEDQGAIFEEFRQVGTADKKAEGTGLGLTLCRKFVELHGGRIWVKSQVGAGSTFTFTIPVRRGEYAPATITQ